MKRKLSAILVALCLVVTLLPVPAAAAAYTDTEGHWAASSIDRWSDFGMIQGSNGQFNPNGTLTRAHMATMLCRLLNLPAAGNYGFLDVSADDWFADAVNRCAAAGIMLGNNGYANPNAPITREQAMVMLCRALGLEEGDESVLDDFADADLVAPYARGYLAALVDAGILKGDNGCLNPKSNITRAQMVVIVDRIVDNYANKDGQTLNAKSGGTVLVVADDVTVKNAPAGATIIVAEGVTGLTVNGKKVADGQTYTVPKTTTSSGSSSSGGGHSHRYAADWSYDETHHWHEATCGHDVTSGYAAHSWTYTSDADTHTKTCVCGKTVTESHVYGADNKCVCGKDITPNNPEVQNPVAVIGSTGYATLEDAFTAAVENDTVILLDNVTLNGAITVSKTVTLNLNGKNISMSDTDTAGNGMFHITGGTMTINGEGTLNGASDGNDYDMVIWADGGNVVINGGTYVNESNDDYDDLDNLNNNEVIYVKNGGKATINGGTFKGNNPKFTLNSHDTLSGTIEVKGGKFYGFNPAAAYTELVQPKNFLAEGYGSKADGEYYVVTEHQNTHTTTTATDWTVAKNIVTCSTCGYTAEAEDQTTFHITSVDDLKGFAARVSEDDMRFEGKTVELDVDLNLADSNFNGVGKNSYATFPGYAFNGTFDGNDHTISNMRVSSAIGNEATAGFFPQLGNNATVKDLKFTNATVTSTHEAGVVAGFCVVSGGHMSAKIENCYVTNSTVTSAAHNKAGGAYDDGDKVGGIIGLAHCDISNCSVTNTRITAVRDLGGIVGALYGTVTDCTVSGNTLAHDTTNINRQENKGEIVGRFLTGQLISNITTGVKMTQNSAGTVYEISTADGLMWFADQVNNKGNSFAGMTVKLTADIDLQDAIFSGIGASTVKGYPGNAFSGIFDGQNYAVKNMTIGSSTELAMDGTENRASRGFFNTLNGTVQNLKLTNVKVDSTHYAGTVAGYATSGTITDCTVDGATVTSTQWQKEGGSYEDGDKAGGIIGYAAGATVSNNTVKNTSITAFRDLGGIVGCADGSSTNVSGNTVDTVTLVKGSSSHDTVGDIVGRQEGSPTIGTNTILPTT